MSTEKVYSKAVDPESEKCASKADASSQNEEGANMADYAAPETDTMADENTAAAPDFEAEIAEWKDKYVRLHAEFDNYRKRTLREKLDLVETGGRDVLKAVLPVADDIQRAVEAMGKSDDIEALRRGVELISQKFIETLRQCKVTAIEAVGQPFDEEWMEAVAKFKAGEEQKGKVIDVVQTGYRLGDKVLRFAKVVVGE